MHKRNVQSANQVVILRMVIYMVYSVINVKIVVEVLQYDSQAGKRKEAGLADVP